MALRSALLITVALAAVSTTSADFATCGLWKTAGTCEDPEANPYNGGINGTMQLLGTVAGDMFMDFFRYTDENCGTPLLYAHVIGTFNDMGPIDQEHQDQRKFAFNFSLAYIEPLSQTGVEAMESLCPCNGTDPNSPSPWAVNETKVLSTCDPDNCDISFFGGTEIRFDAPAFTIVNISADGGFSIGLMDVDPNNGFANPDAYLEYPVSQSACTTETTANLCGSFSTNAFETVPCEVILNPWTNVIMGSKITNFTFRGPPTDVPVLGSYGVYTASIDYFSDTHCGVLEARVTEEGSLGYYQRDTTSGLYVVKKNPARYSVLPAQSAAGWATLANLTQNCGCGSTWVVGSPRTITSCPDHTCETPIFTDWNAPGTPSYAYAARNTTSLDGLSADTTFFGSWNTSVTGLTSSGLKTSLEKVPTPINACESGAFTPDLCGTYQTTCSNSPTLLDTTKEITLSGLVSGTGNTGGANNASAEGRITYTQAIFNNTGAGCQQADTVYIIAGTGYYSQDEFATTPQVNGLYSVDIDFTSFEITPKTQEATDLINNAAMGCPCGGVWQVNVKRTLHTCPATTCTAVWMSTILPGGEFGQAGYGVVQYNVVDKVMRLSALSTDMGEGYAMQFDEETNLLHQTAACPAASNPDPNGDGAAFFGGCWDLPCFRVDAGANSYAMSGEYDRGLPGVNPDIFVLNRSIFTVGSGCANVNAKLVDISGEGKLTMKGRASGIAGGYVAEVDMSRTTVTPVGTAGADLLNQQCGASNPDPSQQCGTWVAGTAQHFESTGCSCTFLTGLAGFPLQAGTVYSVLKVWDYGGNNQKVDDALRMATFSTSEAAATSSTLTRQNGEYARSTSTSCPFNPYSPSHGAASGRGSKTGMQGGDIFILLLFISATVYFGGGMLFNYQRTGGYNNGGTPVIPHVTFWRALPGLVSDGFKFAVVERFGTRSGGGSGKYSAFGGPGGDSNGTYSDGSYGAL